jgi:uncharacterized protein (TIGR02757 family)
MEEIKARLDREILARNVGDEITSDRPDPLLIASRYRDETIALICALFAYGSAKAIVKFLEGLDFSLLEASDEVIKQSLSNHYYRFQNSHDVATLFIALKRLKEEDSIESLFAYGYQKEGSILDGLWHFIERLQSMVDYESRGYRFLIGTIPQKIAQAGAYKRYMMYLRWMVRSDAIDLGLWSTIDKKDLLMPLDTHTFTLSQRLGLLERKSCDLKASIALTEQFKAFDPLDPIKYDFALYRLGQEKLL